MEAFGDAQQILRSLPCACAVFDDAGKVDYANPFLCQALEYEAKELLGQSFERILTISSRLFYQTHFFPLLRLNGKVNEIFLTLRAKSGESIPVMVNGTRQELDGRIANLCVCFPVWERQKYENELLQSKKTLQKALEDNETLRVLRQELEQHQRRLDQQVSILIQRSQEYVQLNKVLSHDLQEPIRKISLYADILLNNNTITREPALHAHAQKIQDLTERLRSLTHCLQQFVSVESHDEEFAPIQLNALLNKATQEASRATGFSDFSVEGVELPQVEGRATQIGMLFRELIKNAIENRNPASRLHIKIGATIVEENSYHASKGKYRYTDHVRLEIRDNGMGFEKRYSTYVMELFNKLNPESKGMGMGLALCRQIVSNHYGTLSIQAAEGAGCTVAVMLPIKQPENQ